ncbi:Cyclin, N-terminal domain containing protein [Tritrichomonas foetus]|uniref:Cyclin, N-terminal domain containing protein n=1 Tax=Tritrichomonas foetus TaxID=1144522 RepID=A0A1J4JI59_9EUKA|nr:Cyclin, N-terminal domain containing protein [Tritrichomonas foetus]|eukprot:OHS98872.1 Cyclin, N-terminal domain containing protein [Tritrichomonas foetus]
MQEKERNRVWTEEQRSHAWIIVSFARIGLNLSVSPCIASAFILLHNYFADPNHSDEELYILLTAALFLACKIEDTYRSMELIFKELANSILLVKKRLKPQQAKEYLGDRDFSKNTLTIEEMKKVGICEIHILNSIGWNMEIDLPFSHFNEIQPAFNSMAQTDANDLQNRFNYVLRDICLILKNENYLKIPPPISAAAAILHAFHGKNLPENAVAWIEGLQKQSPELFQMAYQIIVVEGAKCVPIGK